MRSIIAALFLWLAVPTFVEARPSPYRSPDVFSGDRWLYAQGGTSAADVNRAMGCPPPHCARVRTKRKHSRVTARHMPSHHVGRGHKMVSAPLPRSRPTALPMDEDQLAAHAALTELYAGAGVTIQPPPRKSLIGGALREIGRAFGVPRRFVRGRLICAVNVNAALAERGIQGTRSALAKSFLRWGKPSRPVPGAVTVFNRGRSGKSGHVAIVHHVKSNGTVIYLNPSSRRQAWVVGPYRARPIAFRVAS